jgi:phage tail-like protein
MAVDRIDPYLGFNFVVEIKGLQVAGFTEVSGLQVEVEVQDYREGGLNTHLHRLPGPARYPNNLVLRRGLVSDDLWRWHQAVVKGQIERRNGSVILRDRSGQERWRWNFEQAYPVRWSGPELRAQSAEVAVEVVELVHRGISKE